MVTGDALAPRIVERDNDGWQQLPEIWPDCLRKIMAARGIRRESDLVYALDQLPRPELMLGMEQAVSLLVQAVTQQHKIMIIADFDADGATSCAVAIRGLQAMGLATVDYLVPNRFTHGYGLSAELVAEIPVANQPDLLITVDNGIASHQGVRAAHSRGIKVIVTDHHLPGETLPDADAIVNPNQHGDTFPSKNLAGVGVCFYVLLGLRQQLRHVGWFEQQKLAEPKLVDLLDLVALGTVADVVPLDKLNRTLVNLGLARIRHGLACEGINALLEVAAKDRRQLASTDLGFAVAPRLNAAGRMEDMRLGINTLLTDDYAQALAAARHLDQINHERRFVEQDMQQQAMQMLAELDLGEQQMGYCLYQPDWHQGVIGLLASRIKEHVHRPVIAFAAGNEGEIKGSARSIAGIHIRDVLAWMDAKSPGLIDRFGGHAMAAGLTMDASKLAEFEALFTDALVQLTQPEVFEQTLLSDGELNAAEINLDFAEQLPMAAPWGQGFAEPVFHGRFRVVEHRVVGQDASHLRLTLQLADNRKLTAMAFRHELPDWLGKTDEAMLHYRLAVNEFRQQKSVQLLVDKLLPVS